MRNIKHAHDDIPTVRNEKNGDKRLENPLKEDGCVKIVHIVLFDYHVYQLIAHYKGDDDTRNRDNDVFRQAAYHIENARVPPCGSSSQFGGNLANLRIYAVKQAGQVSEYSVCENTPKPFFQHLSYQGLIPPFPHTPAGGGSVRIEIV